MRQLLQKKKASEQEATSAGAAECPGGHKADAGYPADSPGVESQAPTAKVEGRGEAIKASMKKLLAKKSASTVFDAVFESDAASPSAPSTAKAEAEAAPRSEIVAKQGAEEKEEDEDPWPEVRLSPTVLGIEDGQQRAAVLTRRGEFAGACSMWAKVCFTARRCRPPLNDAVMAELEAAHEAAKADVPPPPEPPVEPPSSSSLLPPDSNSSSPPLVHRASSSSAVPQGASGARGANADVSSKLEERQPSRGAERRAVASGSSEEVAAGPDSGVVPEASPLSNENFDPAAWNQAFFAKMEKGYDDLCAADGWDDIRQRQNDMQRGSRREADMKDAIPADSDYWRVPVPADGGRELRRDPAAAPIPIPEVPEERRRPRRNLDELRRVEAATREAMQRERDRRAALAARSGPTADASEERPPIRTKSDTMRIDSLSDNSDGDDDEERMSELRRNEQATLRALAEFEKLGKEKEELLAKYRERWG